MATGFVMILTFIFGSRLYLIKCEQFQIRKDNLDKVLVGHSVMEINGTNLHDCARDCMSFAICKSFDYDRNERSCKLNDVDSSSVDPSEFIAKIGSIFSDINEWPSAMVKTCGTRQCLNDQKCLVNGGSFVCRDITCDIYQQIENGSIQVFASDENRFRDKALVKCNDGYTPSQNKVECQASGKWQPAICKKIKITDCKDIIDTFPNAKSGVYNIELWKSREILTVNCDMETEGGGWTLFHRRMDGSVDFYRNFTEYENGFGNIDGELWLGLKYIQELAEQGTTDLRLDMTNENNVTGQETFQEFMLTDGMNYKLNIGSLNSSDFDTKSALHGNNGKRFSTFDRDVDGGANYNCAELQHGAWWYFQCSAVNLNGLYVTPGTKCNFPDAISGKCGHQHSGFNSWKALKRSSMMLKRIMRVR